MYVFRLHIRPGGGKASMADTFAYCRTNSVLGVGWRTGREESTTDWDDYLHEAENIYANLNVCKYFRKWVGEGDLIWTRDLAGHYFLARVKSGWEYFVSEEAIRKDIDIANVVRCDLKPVDLDEVPGKVVACFRAPRTIQEIQDPTATEYSKFLWNTKAGQQVYDLDAAITAKPDIFALLDSEETEDLVFLYLQQEGWFVVPNSRKADTFAFEYQVIKPQENTYADVQVKTGNTVLRPDTYTGYARPVILFQAQERYEGPPQPHVTCLSREVLLAFAHAASPWLPARYRRKMEMLRSPDAA